MHGSFVMYSRERRAFFSSPAEALVGSADGWRFPGKDYAYPGAGWYKVVAAEDSEVNVSSACYIDHPDCALVVIGETAGEVTWFLQGFQAGAKTACHVLADRAEAEEAPGAGE